MTVTIDQAREAKEELKPILRAIFNGRAVAIGLGAKPGKDGGQDYGVAVRFQWTLTDQEKQKLPLTHTTKSNVTVSVQYEYPGPARAF